MQQGANQLNISSIQVPAGDDCKATFQRVSEWLTAAQFSVKPGRLAGDKATFTAKTFSQGWKNQRRKRREQKRDEEERIKVTCEPLYRVTQQV